VKKSWSENWLTSTQYPLYLYCCIAGLYRNLVQWYFTYWYNYDTRRADLSIYRHHARMCEGLLYTSAWWFWQFLTVAWAKSRNKQSRARVAKWDKQFLIGVGFVSPTSRGTTSSPSRFPVTDSLSVIANDAFLAQT
jgi:hypothetical protein